jgi:hypothetical protein
MRTLHGLFLLLSSHLVNGLMTVQYLGELALYYAITCRYRPSIIATAIISYVLTFTSVGGRNLSPGADWVCFLVPPYLLLTSRLSQPKTLETLSGYSKDDILPCQRDLRDCMRSARADRFTSDVVFSHYSLASNYEVARWCPHELPPS